MFGLEKSKKYMGEFKNGMPHGQGICEFANGDKYVGEFRDGKCEGYGILTYANGGKFIGEFSDNRATGEGKHILGEFEKWMETIFVEA
jgi:hypothetical protein